VSRLGAASAAGSVSTGQRKVVVIAEENENYSSVIGSRSAPYLNSLAKNYGLATAMDAGYPTGCPSLAAYILLTSGSTQHICDDAIPAAHPLRGASIFGQVAASGRQWRGYAESMPTNCAQDSTADGVYLVRHAPAPYYLSERAHCRDWDVPLGTPTTGHLHDDLAAGTLPAYSFVTPDACHDMHGASSCTKPPIASADAWLRQWMPTILASPDYSAGRLVVLIVWDEGSATSNHIPAIVISPGTHHITSATNWTHCSILRTTEDLLGLSPLGCATGTTSLVSDFHLNQTS
jgi:phosphatidylinositol-3-phosphatase